VKRALISGATGQDGSYLAELLLSKGYAVHGFVRRGASFNTWRIDHLLDRLTLHHGDLLDPHAVRRAVLAAQPHEVYHLGAPSHVAESFASPAYALDVITQGTLHVLEACRDVGDVARIYIASSSEMFGATPPPQSELSAFAPRSPYAAAKVAAHHLAGVYRDAYGLHVARGILFNHDSPRRLPTFVTRKITRGLARIRAGLDTELVLGDTTPKRDWGHARDYVRAMWLMLQQDEPGDYVIATGRSFSVNDFLAQTARSLVGPSEDRAIAHLLARVKRDGRYLRPAEVPHLCGDASKAKRELGWEPLATFEELVTEMASADYAEALEETAGRR